VGMEISVILDPPVCVVSQHVPSERVAVRRANLLKDSLENIALS
jgi:hypothetical protein